MEKFYKYGVMYGNHRFIKVMKKEEIEGYYFTKSEFQENVIDEIEDMARRLSSLRQETDNLQKPLEQIKLEAVVERLKHYEGNRTETAKSLNISIRTIRNYINTMKADHPELYEQFPSNGMNELWHEEMERRRLGQIDSVEEQ